MRIIVLTVGLVLMASSAQAATLNVVGGQLLGASGVIVDGSLYNVEFLEGTCIDLYSGCDRNLDFTFHGSGAGLLAAQALLDQVFFDGVLGNFDSEPGLTRVCNRDDCRILTPYGLNGAGTSAAAAHGSAFRGEWTAPNIDFGILRDHDTAQSGFAYAVWTPVPEPGTAVLMGLGLLGLSVSNRRQR